MKILSIIAEVFVVTVMGLFISGMAPRSKCYCRNYLFLTYLIFKAVHIKITYHKTFFVFVTKF